MSLFDKLRSIFASERLPTEDRRAYAEARDLPGLLQRLEDATTRNEVSLRQIRAALSKLELTERATITSIKRGNISGRGVRIAIQTVARYRKQLDALERKADVINRNLNLHINLMGKIELMQAMEMRGVSPELIDQIILDFTENVDKYQTSASGSEAIVSPDESMLTESERKELETLEHEIFGEARHFKRGKVATAEQPNVREPADIDKGERFEPLVSDAEVEEALSEGEKAMGAAKPAQRAKPVRERGREKRERTIEE